MKDFTPEAQNAITVIGLIAIAIGPFVLAWPLVVFAAWIVLFLIAIPILNAGYRGPTPPHRTLTEDEEARDAIAGGMYDLWE